MSDPVTATPPADLTRETLLSLAQAARRFPPARRGRPVHSSTIWRWARRGVRVPGVGVVHLECVRVSGRWLTSAEAISRFVGAQTPAPTPAVEAGSRTLAQRRRASDRAAAALDKMGV